MRSVPGVGVGRVWVAAPVVALDDVEPVLDVVEWLAADVVDVGATVAGVGAAFHEAGGAQDAKVLADERLAAPEGMGEPGGGAGLVRERPDDPLAHRLGEQGPALAGRVAGATRHGWAACRCGYAPLLVAYPDRVPAMRPTGVPVAGGGLRVCHTTGAQSLEHQRCDTRRGRSPLGLRGHAAGTGPPTVLRRQSAQPR